MKAYKILISVFLLLFTFQLSAQAYKVKGKVLNPQNRPVQEAVITLSGMGDPIVTDENGAFEITTDNSHINFTVKAEGYYSQQQSLNKRSEIKIILIPITKSRYTEDQILPINGKTQTSNSSSVTLSKKDFGTAYTIENALAGEVAGLQIINKSSMPGEGSYFNLRGIHSLEANTAPLVVINGVPYLPDTELSPIINGYSRGMFGNYDINDISNITVLKGAAASIYGSMGSNGVILIETDGASADNMDTRISFSGQYGVNFNDKRLPMMNRDEYRSYLNDIGMTEYTDMAKLQTQFPFLADDKEYYYNYLYNNNNNWQDEIYKSSFVTDNVLRIEGGDAIAKYDISLGYMKDGGIIDNTSSNRYHTQINTNITVSRKFEIFTTVGLAYTTSDLMEQGMINQTNPILAAYGYAPLLAGYLKEKDESLRNTFNTYKYGVSNPLAITNSLVAQGKIYDVNIRAGLRYRPADHYTLSGTVGLLYNYNRENVFIPGVTDGAILPLNDNQAKNTVRSGVGETINMFYNINAAYDNVFNDIHALNANIGIQILNSRKEYDAGSGYNTDNDFYQTLDYVDPGSEKFFGYINLWNWMNFYAHADYTYNNLVKASFNISLDAASSVGKDATRFTAYPSAAITFMAKNLRGLQNSSWLSRLDLRAEYGLTGNSRFSSNYAKNYYKSVRFMDFSGIVRSNVPNTHLKAEQNIQLNIGTDFSLFKHRIDVSFDYYKINSTNLIFAQPATSSAYGSSFYYNNAAEINNDGIEISLQAGLIRTRNFDWTIGGNIAFLHSEVKSLGAVNKTILKYSDGSEVITRVGDDPYSFYGYRSEGIFRTQAEADAAALRTAVDEPFMAGDVRFCDIQKDGIINDQDKVILGKATPDYFGGFYTTFRYKGWSLDVNFTYSQGNKAYNAVRRNNEALNSWANQSVAATNRWMFDGQVTDVPRAIYGDPRENSRFSDRWIEDASYLKLKNITLGYTINRTLFKFIRSAHIYVSADNLYTWTKYLGMDPEFAYSYNEQMLGCDFAKAALPKSVKFGFNLKF